jgi:4-amino-4-deoxy-L-arabinose transferase-like glycosyltransferase
MTTPSTLGTPSMTTATLTAPAPTAATPPSGRTWTTPALVVLLVGTAALYLWDITASGWGNGYYAAATQAGAQSWTAWLFGGLDAGGVITVDKPPAALWVSGLFARVLGFSSWTVLAPQAIEGVLAVWLLYATVKRTSGAVAGLMAGAALAVTPVAVLVFRFNLPDALLVLLMVAGAYCTVRAVEKGSGWWLALAGVAVGFAFLAKMGQAFLVLPAFTAAYLLAAPTTLLKRVLHVLGAGVAVAVSAGWFIALVELWPTASRPYIGGSSNDSLWELAMGYNGLGRIFGGGRGVVAGGGNANIGFGGETGIGRLFGASMGGEISWLLPAALIGMVAGLWFTRRLPRTDRTRAALVLWGLWVLGNGIVFSFMSGITHPYYTVAVAPGVAALVAISGRELWRGRKHLPVRVALAMMIAAAGFWGFALLQRFGEWLPALRWVVAALTVLVATAVVMGVRRVAALALATSMLSTAAFGVATAATPHSGSIPMSGPASYAADGGGMGGGPMDEASPELIDLLEQTTGTWAAATVSAQGAASLSLASGKPVIGIGGWSGGDPAPTLEEFRQYVADGRIGYFVGGGGMGGPRGDSEISEWVAANYEAVTIGGSTVYKLG